MGAWIEIQAVADAVAKGKSRPRMGAWIEMNYAVSGTCLDRVAPVWGRGLKSGPVVPGYRGQQSPPYGGVD